VNLSQIFDIVLVTLSISTVFLTLVSYALFKLKQMEQGPEKNAEKGQHQSPYFKRYQPISAQSVEPEPVSIPDSPDSKYPWLSEIRKRLPTLQMPVANRSLTAFFLIVSAVLFTSLTVERYVSGPGERTVASMASRISELSQKGLLRSFDFREVAAEDPPQLVESISLEQAEALEARLDSLRGHTGPGKSIVLVAGGGPKNSAVSSWRRFLNDMRVPWNLAASLQAVGSADLVIVPGASWLKDADTKILDEFIRQGTSVLITGPTFEVSGWAEKRLGIKLIKNEAAGHFLPTIFASGSAPYWDVPPGVC
jgi:hypothetical protein